MAPAAAPLLFRMLQSRACSDSTAILAVCSLPLSASLPATLPSSCPPALLWQHSSSDRHNAEAGGTPCRAPGRRGIHQPLPEENPMLSSGCLQAAQSFMQFLTSC